MDWTIEFSWGILLTSFTGSLFFLFWRLAGRRLERAGLAGAEFGLLSSERKAGSKVTLTAPILYSADTFFRSISPVYMTIMRSAGQSFFSFR